MSENTAFKTHASSHGEPSLYVISDGLTFRYNEVLPTEYMYKMPSPERKFFKTSGQYEREVINVLKDSGMDIEEAKEIREAFTKQCYDIFSKNREADEVKKKAVIEQITKVAIALANVTKTKLLEYVHTLDEDLEEMEKEVAAAANEIIKKHKAKA